MVDILFMLLICVGCAIIIIVSVWCALEYMEQKEVRQCTDFIALSNEIKKGVDESLKLLHEMDELSIDIKEKLNLTIIEDEKGE